MNAKHLPKYYESDLISAKKTNDICGFDIFDVMYLASVLRIPQEAVYYVDSIIENNKSNHI